MPIADYVVGVAFLAYIFAILVMALDTLVFGVSMLRANAALRAAAWLLIAALPVGLPLAYGFTTSVMGELADPWAGVLVFYGLAWIVLGRHLVARGTEPSAEIPEATFQ